MRAAFPRRQKLNNQTTNERGRRRKLLHSFNAQRSQLAVTAGRHLYIMRRGGGGEMCIMSALRVEPLLVSERGSKKVW